MQSQKIPEHKKNNLFTVYSTSPYFVPLNLLFQESYCLEKELATHPVFLPDKSRGQRRLVGYSLWGCKELATKQQLKKFQTGQT